MSRTREAARAAFKQKIMDLMYDGRSRTTTDIELALNVEVGRVGSSIRWLVHEGKINSESVKGYIVYTIAEASK